MANEILTSGIGDLIAGEVLAAEYLMLLADRDSSVLNHPAIMRATATSPHSNVVRVPHLGLGGYDLLTDVTPGSEVANTAFSDGSTDVTIAARAKRYTATDLAKYVAAGKLGPAMFAQDLVISVAQTMISLIANVGDDFTTTISTTGVALVWSKVLEAKAALGVAKANGPLMAIFSPVQWGHLEADALGLGVLPAQTNAGIVNAGLSAYKGRYFGIDCYVSSHVPTANAGADRAGCLLSPGAIAWADAQMPSDGDPNIADFGTARLERVRQGNFLSTSYVFSHHGGCAKAIDAAGVSIISDAG